MKETTEFLPLSGLAKLASDPRQNAARMELVDILSSLIPPPNFRVTLDIDSSEMLSLKVLRRNPKVFKVFGMAVWRTNPLWDNPNYIQRQLIARTYAGLLTQLKERPEFLEFELTFEGCVDYQVAVDL